MLIQMIKNFWKNHFSTIIKAFSIINIVLFEISIGMWIRIGQEHLFFMSDFGSLYTSFVDMRAAIFGKISEINLHAIYQHGLLGGINLSGGIYPLQYPPIIALVFSPLSFLPFNLAFIIWTIIEVGLLIWLIYLFDRLFSEWSRQERLVLIVTLLAFFPLTETILTGQFSLFLSICLVQVFLSMKNNRPIHAGIWMALLLIKPQMVLIPGLMLLNKRFWRGAVSAALTYIALLIFTSLLFGLEPWIKYFQLLVNMNINYKSFSFIPEIEYTLKGMLTKILVNSQSSTVTLLSNIALLLGMGFVLYLWLTRMPTTLPRLKLFFAFTLVISVLLSLHIYNHDDLVLVLPTALFYDYLRQMRFNRKGYSILLMVSPLVFFIGFFTTFSLFGFLLLPTAIILLLLGWIIACMILDYRVERINRLTKITPTYSS
jgi:hypothetical protein